MASANPSSLLKSIRIPAGLSRHTDVMFAIAAVVVIMMLIIPVPVLLLDFLLVVDVLLALLVLLMVLNVKSAKEFSVFPSVILLMTGFRLALNVSTTRAILTQGANFNGSVINAFADFVVGGNIFVGIVIFLILIIIQFTVITKGATRVAEVSARFALDGMAAKLMAVESELQAGVIDNVEAEAKRKAVRDESDFYGTMDGASKFVQGDVVASIIITIVNIIGGFAIGMIMRGETVQQAAGAYVRFTIGDGLVTQIPSFFMSFATGLLLTRSASESNLSGDISKQIFSRPKNLFMASGFAFLLMFLPGFPKIVLFVLSALLGLGGYAVKKQREEMGIDEATGKPRVKEDAAPTRGPLDVTPLLKVEKIELSVGTMLIPLVDEVEGGDLLNRVTHIRRELALELGIVVPPVRITDNSIIEGEEYVISVNGTEMARALVYPNMLMAFKQGDNVEPPYEECERTSEPAFGLPAFWVSVSKKEMAERNGFMIFSPSAVIATHLTETIRKNANLLLGREEVQNIMNMVKETHPTLVSEVMSLNNDRKESPLSYIQKVLQNLLRDGISIRNTVAILEGVADAMSFMRTDQATELVRSRLGSQISQSIADSSKTIRVIMLSQSLQNDIASSLVSSGDMQGSQIMTLSVETMHGLIKKMRDSVKFVEDKGYNTVFLVGSTIRLPLSQFVSKNVGKYFVIATSEITQGYKVESLAIIR